MQVINDLKSDFYKKCIKYADVEFVCSDGERVLGNKCILASRSVFFDIMFQGRFESNKQKTIEMGCDSRVLNIIIPLLYRSEKKSINTIIVIYNSIITNEVLNEQYEDFSLELINYTKMVGLNQTTKYILGQYLKYTSNLTNALLLKNYEYEDWIKYIKKIINKNPYYDIDEFTEDMFVYLINKLGLQIFLNIHYKSLIFKFSDIVMKHLDKIIIRNNWKILTQMYDKKLLFEIVIHDTVKLATLINNKIVVYISICINTNRKKNIYQIKIPLIKGMKIYKTEDNEIKSYVIEHIQKNFEVMNTCNKYHDYDNNIYTDIHIITEEGKKVRIDENCMYIPSNLTLSEYNK